MISADEQITTVQTLAKASIHELRYIAVGLVREIGGGDAEVIGEALLKLLRQEISGNSDSNKRTIKITEVPYDQARQIGKIQVIKAIRSILNIGLREAKDLADGTTTMLLPDAAQRMELQNELRRMSVRFEMV